MARVGQVRVVLNRRGLYEVNVGPVLSHVRAIAQDTVAFGRLRAPRRTGRLAAALGRTVGSANADGAFCNVTINQRKAPYAKWVIDGTKRIYPKHGSYLLLRNPSWPHRVGGKWVGRVTAKAHSVSGQGANDFLSDALSDAMRVNGHR